MLLAGIGAVVGAFSVLSESGTPTKARILSCAPRPINTAARCRGIWEVDGRITQGNVNGASTGDVGDRIDVRVSGNTATAKRGRAGTAVALFGLAALFLVAGVAMAHPVLRR